MRIRKYQVDAFTSEVFGGNPAAVCPLDDWLPDETLQAIAAENNLSETAFFVEKGDHYKLRWFTPKVEVDLCGHATLASAFVIFNYLDREAERVEFETQSGGLSVERRDEMLAMELPSRRAKACEPPPELVEALGAEPVEVLLARDYLIVYDGEDVVRGISPDMGLLMKVESLGVIVTAPGEETDFVSRFFAPRVGIPEDPVTGSAHSTLIPYWSERLGMKKLIAVQVSERRGKLICEDLGDRVKIAGHAVLYSEGDIWV